MDRIATRITFALVLTVAIALGIVAVGILGVSKNLFADLMVGHGDTESSARAMFDHSVTNIFGLGAAVAFAISIVLAAVLAYFMARPLERVAVAARALATGDYSVRAPERGTREVAAVARAFNGMAETLLTEETTRRQMIADFAHELRTPLTNLQGYLEAMRDGVVEPTPEVFASLGEEVDRLKRLSQSLDLLGEGVKGGAEFVDLDVSAALGDAVAIAGPAFEKRGLQLQTEIPPGLRGAGNPDQLAQVIQNLISNAGRYTPEGGIVEVRAARQGGEVRVAVINTGEAIPSAELPRLWERFYRRELARDRASGGAGIGLAIVRQLVEAAGGRVGAESEGGRNSFWFTLPSR